MAIPRVENLSSMIFGGLDIRECPLFREEFNLIMGSHRKWNEVETLIEGRNMLTVDRVNIERKQNVLVISDEMNFEISGYAILLPNVGPSPISCLSTHDDPGKGLYETMIEVKRYVAVFERARINWNLFV